MTPLNEHTELSPGPVGEERELVDSLARCAVLFDTLKSLIPDGHPCEESILKVYTDGSRLLLDLIDHVRAARWLRDEIPIVH